MAIMIPDTVRASTVSMAEKRLFNRFRNELSDSNYVLHSLGLTIHAHKIWGECDFVILSQGGIFVIEVKGGGVECHDGTWIFTKNTGIKNTKKEGPFEQAKTAMFAVKDFIESNSDYKRLLYGYGVIMPDEVFDQNGPEIELNVLLDKRNIDDTLENFIRCLSRFWKNNYSVKHNSSPTMPDKKMLEEIRLILRPEIKTVYTLNTSFSQICQEQVELTEEQCGILHRMDNNPRTIVNGGAGTGKTILALDKAINLASQNKRVLYLCFNKLLSEYLKNHISKNYSGENLVVDSIHSWFYKIIDEANLLNKINDYTGDKFIFFSEVFPSVYMDSILEIDIEPFDVIIIDEAQDILSSNYIDAIDLTLKGGIDKGRWHFFIDPLQDIFRGTDEKILQRLIGYGCAQFDLTVNCRNTKEIAITTSIYSGLNISSENALEGGICQTKFVNNKKEYIKSIEHCLHQLIEAKVPYDEMIILSSFKKENSSLSDIDKLLDLTIFDITQNNQNNNKRSIEFCTMQSFKGLEKKAVIAIDLFDLEELEQKYLHYCGLSRARVVLYICLQEEQRVAYDKLSKEFGERLAKKIITN